MYYDALSRNTVKITLTRKDMQDYAIRSESLRARTAESKRSLTCFLKRFQSESSLFPDHSAERLFLEAFPSDDGGCIMYVSTLGTDILPPAENEPKYRTLMCITDSLASVIRLCDSITFPVHSSSLCRTANGYCLIVKVSAADCDSLSHLIGEFGALSDDPTDIACICEHSARICTNAVPTLRVLRA